ncbi:MAG: ORF6N domain-containing protein [Bacteroidetes bacterium]|nr:ORF6N domain-containing protein [Bacteroidota bacterium]
MAKSIIIKTELIENKIYDIRGQKVMIDKDLAELYGVLTGNLNKAVKRNAKRFPADFMFQLTMEEYKNLMFQNGISSWGGTRKMPTAFTEQGVAMLSSVLNSDRAIEVNIRIIRIFTKLREVVNTHKDVLLKLEKIEKHLITHGHYIKRHDGEIEAIFEIIDEIREAKNKPLPSKPPIGFKTQAAKK